MKWDRTSESPAVRENVKRRRCKGPRRDSALTESQFLTAKSLALHELANEQIRYALSFSLAIHTYGKNDWVWQFFFHLHTDRNRPVSLLNSARFMQLFIENGHAEEKMTDEMSVLTVFYADLCFHVIAEKRSEQKEAKNNKKALNSTFQARRHSLCKPLEMRSRGLVCFE